MNNLKPHQQVCAVEFGHIMVLLPAAKAIDLVKLLQTGAMLGNWDYKNLAGRGQMKVECQPLGEVRLTTISPDQLTGLEIQPAKGKTLRQRLQLPGKASDLEFEP